MKKMHNISTIEELRREKRLLRQEVKLAEYGMRQVASRASSQTGKLLTTHVLAPLAIGKLGSWLLSQLKSSDKTEKESANGYSSQSWWQPLAAEALALGREWLAEN